MNIFLIIMVFILGIITHKIYSESRNKKDPLIAKKKFREKLIRIIGYNKEEDEV